MCGEACPADGCETVSAMFGSWLDRPRGLTFLRLVLVWFATQSQWNWLLRPCYGDVLVRSSIVFSNSVSADRIVMAASRLLGAAAACVILMSFTAGPRKSYWNGCIKAAIVICHEIFWTQAIFLLKIILKSASKSSFFAVDLRSCFGAAMSDAVARSSIVFCSSIRADRIVMAASRLR